MSAKQPCESAKRVQNIQMTLDGKGNPEDWDFNRADTSYLTHGLHDYPARMIPQIAQRLIDRYSPAKGSILDPFCGSGTTLVEAQLANRRAVGNDINPLAVLLSKVKSTPVDFKEKGFDAVSFFADVETDYRKARREKKLPEPPTDIYHGLLHWFKEPVAVDLQFLYEAISEVQDEDVRDFLKIVFSDTVFKTSNIDLRASRFIRIYHEKELANFRPKVLKQFHKKLISSASIMNQFVRKLKTLNIELRRPTVEKADSRHLPFSRGEFDSAITSPPYGEEKSTIGYTRWSKLSLAWLRLNQHDIRDYNKETLGGVASKDTVEELDTLESPTALKVLKALVKTDEMRVKDALPFFFDYLATMKEVYRVLKHGSYYCIVIGDRSIRKKVLDMERVSVELGAEAQFRHVQSFFRNIPTKLIPWNTPTGKTIVRESIIVFRKE
jgi:site-specific DNA-methyltransferase (cytosine-N4-specific)